MSQQQIVIYKGVRVEPLDRSGDKILVRTRNPADANKVDLPFKELVEGAALFEGWVLESDLVAVE